jgi:hypothetical protein
MLRKREAAAALARLLEYGVVSALSCEIGEEIGASLALPGHRRSHADSCFFRD